RMGCDGPASIRVRWACSIRPSVQDEILPRGRGLLDRALLECPQIKQRGAAASRLWGRLPPEERVDIILPVAGLGTRLRPQTWSKPKPLVSLGGKPMLAQVLDRVLPLHPPRALFTT